MVHKEEIAAELSLNTSILGKAKRDIAEFTREGHLGFLHLNSGAKDFHKLIHQLGDQFPIFGTLVKTAFSPVGGIFAAATLAAAFFLKKIEEIHAELDQRSLENMRPISDKDPYVRQLETARAVNAAIREQQEFLRRDKEAHEDTLKTMNEQLESAKARHEVEKKSTVSKEQQAAIDVKSAQEQLQIIQKTRDSLGRRAYAAHRSANQSADAFIGSDVHALLPQQQDMLANAKKNLDESVTRRNALALASSQVTPEDEEKFRLLPSWQEVKDIAAGFAGQSGLDAKLKLAEEEVKKNTEAYHHQAAKVNDSTEKFEDLKKAMEQTRDTFKTLDGAFMSTTNDLIGAQRQLEQMHLQQQLNHSLNSFAPTEEEAMTRRGPLGDLARRADALRRGIKDRLFAGDSVGAENLRKQLQGFDVQSPFQVPNWKNGGRLEWPAPTHVKGVEEQFNEIVGRVIKTNVFTVVGADIGPKN